MCGGGGSRAPAPPPPPDPRIAEEAKEQRRRARLTEQRTTTELKNEQYEQRVNASYGRKGRRSLLSGSKGGQGFLLDKPLMSKDTLGS